MSSLSRYSIFAVIILSVLMTMLVRAESPPPKPDWDIALKELEKHVAPIIEKNHNHKFSKDNNVSLVRYESRLLEEFLPKYRLYVIDSSLSSSTGFFCFGKTVHFTIWDMVAGHPSMLRGPFFTFRN